MGNTTAKHTGRFAMAASASYDEEKLDMSQIGLRALLTRVRRRLFIVGGISGLCWAVAIAIGVLLTSAWLDLLWDLSPSWRIAAGVVALAIGCVCFALLVIRTLHAAQDREAARRLDSAGACGGVIVSGWDLESQPGRQQSNVLTTGLARIAVHRATQVAQGVPLAQAVPLHPMRRGASVLAALIALLAAAALFLPALFRTELARFVDPYGDVPPFSRLEFTVEPGDVEVVYGEGLNITVSVTGGTVESVDLVVESSGDATEVLPLFPEPGNCWRTSLTRITQDATYFVRAERARSKRYQIRVLTVPQIESVRFRVVPPAYTRDATYDGPLPRDGLVGLAGTQVTVWAKSNRPLSGGELLLDIHNQPEQVALGIAGADANEVTGTFTLAASGKFQLVVRDEAGQDSQEPFGGSITLQQDQRPFVRLLSPRQMSLATPHASLPISLAAEDDYGVQRLQLFRSLNDSRPLPTDLEVPSPAKRLVHQQTQLPLAEYELTPGDEIKLFVRVEDNDPAGAKGSESKVAVVRIISQAEFQRLLQVQQGMDALLSKYQAARRRVEALQEEIRKLLEELEKADPNSEVSEQLKERLNDLVEQMQRDSRAIQQAADQPLPLDADQELSKYLKELAQRLAQTGQQLEQAGNQSGLTKEQLSDALQNAAKQLGEGQQQFNEQAMQPLEHLAKVFPLMQDAARFTDLALRQRDLSERLASLKDAVNPEDPQQRARMRELEEEQQKLSETLRDLLLDIEEHASQLPDVEELDNLHNTALDFVDQLRASGAAQAMNNAESALVEFNGTRAHQEATRAADILESFVSKCEGMGGSCENGLLSFRPSLGSCLGNTARQMLANMGFGSGSGVGMGTGAGGGYSARRGGMSNMGLYGGLPGMVGAEGLTGSGPQIGGRGAPGQLSARGEGDEALLFNAVEGGAGTASGEALVPVEYRRRVGQYFQRVTEETSDQ